MATSTQSVNQGLIEPIAADKPCGDNLEYEDLATLDAFRVFGESTSPDARPDPRDPAKTLPPPPWDEIKSKALTALGKSKDLRLLAYLGTASLRTDGVSAFAEALTVASEWLRTYWSEVFPQIDGDVVARRSALDYFADPMAVIDGLRKAPLVQSRRHGIFSLRDLDIASGKLAPRETDVKYEDARIKAAFAEAPADALDTLAQSVAGAMAAINDITSTMTTSHEGGVDAKPDLDELSSVLGRIRRSVAAQRGQLNQEPGQDGEDANSGSAAAGGSVGAIGSREDAIRALDAVAAFFRRTEPSSPIPLLVDRAKRLVAKNFLEVLEEMAPDGVSQARSAGGLRD
jgi:type VI secretion system protein ImpA